MVNESSETTRSQVLRQLQQSPEPLAGPALAARLGVSRVAIWKQIQELQARGYAIESSARGYRLRENLDTIYPHDFPGRETLIHHLHETDSTMELARQLARDGCPAFTAVVTERQRQGRGRLGRSWSSEPGGLYCTIVLRPQLPLIESARVSFAVAVAVSQTLAQRYGVIARLKWPNDVLVEGRKIAGMLLELEADTDRVAFINVGLGLNVNNDPTPTQPQAVSLRQLTGHPVPRREVLAELLERIEHAMQPHALADIMAQWRACSVTLGQRVRINAGSETLIGEATDVDEYGALLLRLDDGKMRRVIYGDCFAHSDGEKR